jgi:hypothetical protein
VLEHAVVLLVTLVLVRLLGKSTGVGWRGRLLRVHAACSGSSQAGASLSSRGGPIGLIADEAALLKNAVVLVALVLLPWGGCICLIADEAAAAGFSGARRAGAFPRGESICLIADGVLLRWCGCARCAGTAPPGCIGLGADTWCYYTAQCVALVSGVASQHDAASVVRLMDTHRFDLDRSQPSADLRRIWFPL